MRTHSTSGAAAIEVRRALNEAEKAGRFMAAVWFIEDGKIQLRRATWNFPKDDLLKSCQLLEQNIQDELVGNEIEAPPLPVADLGTESVYPSEAVNAAIEAANQLATVQGEDGE